MPMTEPERKGDFDLYEILDEEVQSLPGKYRLPIVLCYLQGKSNLEAARELGCPVGTIKTRLLKARQLLRTRLTYRGVTMSVGSLVAALAEDVSLAAPTTLTSATMQVGALLVNGNLARTSRMTSSWKLANEVIQTMFLEKLKKTFVLVSLVMALVIAGAGVGMFHARAQFSARTQSQVQPQPKAQGDKAGVDPFGDPLPVDAVQRIGTVRLRHGSWVSDLAVSPNGKMLASGGSDRAVRLWDLATGKLIKWFKHTARVNTVAFSPDGKTIAAGDHAGCTLLWDIATGNQKMCLRVDKKNVRYITSLVFAPDGKSAMIR